MPKVLHPPRLYAWTSDNAPPMTLGPLSDDRARAIASACAGRNWHSPFLERRGGTGDEVKVGTPVISLRLIGSLIFPLPSGAEVCKKTIIIGRSMVGGLLQP